MPNKRKICTENLNSNQSIYIPSLNSYYPPENVINSAYRKVLDFKENAEKILEKEKSETLCLNDFSKAILDSRSFEISLQHNCIKLKCYITLEKDKDAKKKRNEQLLQQQQQQQQQHGGTVLQTTPPDTPLAGINENGMYESLSSPVSIYANGDKLASSGAANNLANSGGAKKVNVEVIMKSNPFRVEENEKTTRMELIRNSNNDNSMLRFTYYVRPECEAKKFRDYNLDTYDENGITVFTNDFFTVYRDANTREMNISLNEIVQTAEEQKRTEALGEKLFILLKDRPRHRALLTNECKLNHSLMTQYMHANNMSMPINLDLKSSAFNDLPSPPAFYSNSINNGSTLSLMSATSASSSYMLSPASLSSQEDETFYTRELIHIYGQPIVPSFHKHFNYQLSNTHYGYRTLRRLLNCDILKKYVKITKEEIKSLDRVVEFVQLTSEKCLSAFQLNMTSFYDPVRFENGIVKNWLDVWYVDRLKEKYTNNDSSPSAASGKDFMSSLASPSSNYSLPYSNNNHHQLFNSNSSTPFNITSPSLTSSSWSLIPQTHSTSNSCFLQTSQLDDHEDSECDQANHLWFCLKDYNCNKLEEFLEKLKEYLSIQNNKSELILVHTAHPIFEYKDVLSEARRILAIFLNKAMSGKTLDELLSKKLPLVAREHVESFLNKFLMIDSEKKIVGFTALFEILLVLKRELLKEKNDEMKYSHFLCTLERANQEKLKLAIMQLKCVPCLNKFTTNFNLINSNSNGLNSNNNNCINSNSSNSNSLNSKNMVSHANMSRLLKQMSLIVSTELQQIAIDLIERMDEDKPVKYIKLKDEFKLYQHQQASNLMGSSSAASYHHHHSHHHNQHHNHSQSTVSGSSSSTSQLLMKQQQQINGVIKNLTNSFAKKLEISSSSASLSSIGGSTQQGTNANSTTNTATNATTTASNNTSNLNAVAISSQPQSPQLMTNSSTSTTTTNSTTTNTTAASAAATNNTTTASNSSINANSNQAQTQASSNKIFNPFHNLQQFLADRKAQDLSSFSIDHNTSVVSNSFNYDRI